MEIENNLMRIAFLFLVISLVKVNNSLDISLLA